MPSYQRSLLERLAQELLLYKEAMSAQTKVSCFFIGPSQLNADLFTTARVRSAGGYKTGGKQESREQTMLNGKLSLWV